MDLLARLGLGARFLVGAKLAVDLGADASCLAGVISNGASPLHYARAPD